ncbi:anti-sigma regulatory factor (Ser/Thr protein kinase) [Spinactinospora alkalitolerans]|uniref:Anti-sigma regulatory factor (Ser/Thr protein kinase) n=1 Tax=Spinactinospora alkalitolerans TaxID=687207 RepID=A0A852U1F9_9ACTN|nr:ATP-binding protein [Spinactinospora alkalitolerans]NYE49417.1 anti-sigma regulatory factor (Ser/Thr protein kinase) [Spinactinospora alkalitolerans]
MTGHSAFAVNTERSFPGTCQGLRRSRRFLRWGIAEVYPRQVDDAELCLSEAFTNAVKHTLSGRPGGRVTVRAYALTCGPLYVDVLDQGPVNGTDRPAVDPRACDLDAEHGRGLHLIHELTRYWTYLPGRAHGCLCLTFDVPALPRRTAAA